MDKAFLAAYVDLLIKTCHRRGIHAMGGMAAQIPIKNDPGGERGGDGKVRADKLREVRDGHDGTWVAHPGLVPMAKRVLRRAHAGAEPDRQAARRTCTSRAADLLAVPEGTRSPRRACARTSDVGVHYLEAWLGGLGCVPLYNLMEDAATAEISRTQLWQWIHHGAKLDDGRHVTAELFRRCSPRRCVLRGGRRRALRHGVRRRRARSSSGCPRRPPSKTS